MAVGDKNMAKNKSSFLKMVSVLTIIAVISAFVLAFVENITKEPIQKAKNQKELDAIAEVVGEFDNDPFAEQMTITTPDKKHKLKLYPARKNGVVSGFAVKTYSNSGYGGRIELIVGFYIDGSIRTFKITKHNETPGLGSKADEPKFKKQFDGFNPNKHKFRVRQDGGEIDGITAATITSRAVIRAIKQAVKAYNNFNKGNSHE